MELDLSTLFQRPGPSLGIAFRRSSDSEQRALRRCCARAILAVGGTRRGRGLPVRSLIPDHLLRVRPLSSQARPTLLRVAREQRGLCRLCTRQGQGCARPDARRGMLAGIGHHFHGCPTPGPCSNGSGQKCRVGRPARGRRPAPETRDSDRNLRPARASPGSLASESPWPRGPRRGGRRRLQVVGTRVGLPPPSRFCPLCPAAWSGIKPHPRGYQRSMI